MAAGDYRGARQAFARELEIQPEDPFALDNLGNLQLVTRAPAEALATYRKISEAPLRDTGVAMAEHSLGHDHQSQQALEAAIAKGRQGFASQIADSTMAVWRHSIPTCCSPLSMLIRARANWWQGPGHAGTQILNELPLLDPG